LVDESWLSQLLSVVRNVFLSNVAVLKEEVVLTNLVIAHKRTMWSRWHRIRALSLKTVSTGNIRLSLYLGMLVDDEVACLEIIHDSCILLGVQCKIGVEIG
jgi:hypothetical protein